jgi:nucleoside triphosphate pyrophosphatase
MAELAVVLASASERRRRLLEEAGLAFAVQPVEVDETLPEFGDPEQLATRLARDKALASARRPGGPRLVIGADTIVAVEQRGRMRLLGKPVDEREALQMLAWLSGTRHLVATGVCVVRAPELTERSDCERTWVCMRPITAAERAAYVASGEWRGKAGGYAIQDTADRFVLGLEEGGLDNVVGLPVERTLRLLASASAAGAGAP